MVEIIRMIYTIAVLALCIIVNGKGMVTYMKPFSLLLKLNKISMSRARNLRCATFLSFFLIACPLIIKAQTTYTQISNEIDLVRAINDRWSAELGIAGTYSNTPSEDRIFKTNIQRNIIGWAHYQYSPRWKFSSFLAYFHNKDVPEIGQFKAPEWRFALQGRYYFHKTGYIMNTDIRAEVRFISDTAGVFEDIYRYRQKFKYLQPINSQILRKGVVFVYASDEIIFRSKAKETGMTHFDRNLFTVGAGYLITDDLQIELAYVNEFVPRDDGNIIYNVLSLTLTVNNLLRKVGKLIAGEPKEPVVEE